MILGSVIMTTGHSLPLAFALCALLTGLPATAAELQSTGSMSAADPLHWGAVSGHSFVTTATEGRCW